jgi:hypothetical protein
MPDTNIHRGRHFGALLLTFHCGQIFFDVQRAEILFAASAAVVLMLYGHIYTATARGACEHAPVIKALETATKKGALANTCVL